MPGSTVLDVVLGLGLVFFLLATLCAAVREGIGRVFEEREAGLVAGLYRALGEVPPAKLGLAEAIEAGGQAKGSATGSLDAKEIVQRVVAHPLLSQLRTEDKAPAYIPPRAFVLALLDVIAPTGEAPRTLQDMKAVIDTLPDIKTKKVLLVLLKNTGTDLVQFQQALEMRFDDSMAAASAWYKRRSQVVIGLVAVVVTLVFNADAIEMASTLYRDPVVRALVVARAAREPAPPPTPAGVPEATKQVTSYGSAVASLSDVGLPLGWKGSPFDLFEMKFLPLAFKVVGWALTALSLLLGAPFWFEILTKLTSLRTIATPPRVTPKEAA